VYILIQRFGGCNLMSESSDVLYCLIDSKLNPETTVKITSAHPARDMNNSGNQYNHLRLE
jgi:hypothetical protein